MCHPSSWPGKATADCTAAGDSLLLFRHFSNFQSRISLFVSRILHSRERTLIGDIPCSGLSARPFTLKLFLHANEQQLALLNRGGHVTRTGNKAHDIHSLLRLYLRLFISGQFLRRSITARVYCRIFFMNARLKFAKKGVVKGTNAQPAHNGQSLAASRAHRSSMSDGEFQRTRRAHSNGKSRRTFTRAVHYGQSHLLFRIRKCSSSRRRVTHWLSRGVGGSKEALGLREPAPHSRRALKEGERRLIRRRLWPVNGRHRTSERLSFTFISVSVYNPEKPSIIPAI